MLPVSYDAIARVSSVLPQSHTAYRHPPGMPCDLQASVICNACCVASLLGLHCFETRIFGPVFEAEAHGHMRQVPDKLIAGL